MEHIREKGYDLALDEIMDIMDNASDLVEAAYAVRRFIIKQKTGVDIAKLEIRKNVDNSTI